jgi:transcriptional antiterminator NusG
VGTLPQVRVLGILRSARAVSHCPHSVFTYPRREKKVAAYFRDRAIEVFLPAYKAKHHWKNRQTAVVEIPLFPGYLFSRIQPQQRRSALGVSGVISILGDASSSATVPEHHIETLRSGLALGRILPHPQVEIGDRVRIIAGPMGGVTGILVHIRSEFRIVLSIEMIRQCVSIEVERDEIEPELGNGVATGFGLRKASS